MLKKVAVRGLAVLASRIFFVWGFLTAGKGLWDLFGRAPEANFFSSEPWQFVTKAEWQRYAGFELAYGLACIALGWALFSFSKKLPIFIEKGSL